MGNLPSNPSVTDEVLHLGEEVGLRRIAFMIDPSLLIREGAFYALPLTAAEARSTAISLLDMAADVERLSGTRGKP